MEIKKITDDMRRKLREPLPQEALKAIDNKPHLSSINQIYIIERLNDVFGVGTWQVRDDLVNPLSHEIKTSAKGREYNQFTSLIKVSLTIPEYGVYHECIAGSTNEDGGDSTKGGITDGLTKIASWLEIGIDIYKGKQSHIKTPQPTTQSTQQPHTEPVEVKDDLKALIGMPAEKEIVELYWSGRKGDKDKLKQFETLYPNLELAKSDTGKYVFQPKGFYKGVKK